jgi:hypothetical protein
MTAEPVVFRKIRCRMIGRHGNRCPNEALGEFGLCLADLRETAEEWQRVVADAVAQFPSLIDVFRDTSHAD